jgi:hypothetical protein
VVEAPTAVSNGNNTYLLYSGGIYTRPGYAEGEATRRGNPLGRYQRISNRPVLHRDGRWIATGGGSIFHDQDRLVLVYSAFPSSAPGTSRRLFVRPLRVVGKALVPVGRATRIDLQA